MVNLQEKAEEEHNRRLEYYKAQLTEKDRIITRLQSKVDTYISEEKKSNLGKRWGVEKNYSGNTVTVYRNGDDISIHSKKLGELSEEYPNLIEEIKLLTSRNIIFNGKILEDKLYIYDVQLFNEASVVNLPFTERKKILNSLNFGENVKEVYTIIVENEIDLEKTIKAFSRIPGNNGVVVKECESKHPVLGKDSWYVLKGDVKKKDEG